MSTTVHSPLALGARDVLPVALGYVPLGMGMGMTLTGAGLDWWWAPIFSLFMYAGSMQYLIVPMIVAHEPFAAIALATLLIQFRHVFYGISFPLDLVKNKVAKIYSIHALTDEVYAVIASKPKAELTGERVLCTQVFAHATWTLGCTLGALIGLAVPIDGRILNFVLTSLFIVLMLEAYLANRARFDFALAVVIGVGMLVLPGSIYLPVSLATLTVALLIASRLNPVSPSSGRVRRDGMP
ncbi:AzlC family ABC transporter permease [Actinomyces urinae]|uniref:AzlC family ABC transporter permease n=1 Tax=Actinomyces urinae TaxID=1689268 RepID=UPI00093002F4|nr:AzlC family ABC transporter permease [Actinomyces urinae]